MAEFFKELPQALLTVHLFGVPSGTRIHAVRIFLLLYITVADLHRCSLDYALTISLDLGCYCVVSTHFLIMRFGTAFSSRLRRLGSFYSKSFLLGTLYDFS